MSVVISLSLSLPRSCARVLSFLAMMPALPHRAGHYTNGTWYLYYIVGRECPGRWVAYGYATSENGVQWVDHGDMLYPLTEPGVRQSCSNSDYALGSGWVRCAPRLGGCCRTVQCVHTMGKMGCVSNTSSSAYRQEAFLTSSAPLCV